MGEDSSSGIVTGICSIFIVIFLLITVCIMAGIGNDVEIIKNNSINTTEIVEINGKKYKQIEEEITEEGKKVYIIKQEKNINIKN
jgi:Na+-transporting methylmalonyl-CoA/oxaloacetate decarboxylase gamma subunit